VAIRASRTHLFLTGELGTVCVRDKRRKIIEVVAFVRSCGILRPDLAGFAAANGHDGKAEAEILAELGDKFPRHIYHSIICVGRLGQTQGNTGSSMRSARRGRMLLR
jgi:hypothetical protein